MLPPRSSSSSSSSSTTTRGRRDRNRATTIALASAASPSVERDDDDADHDDHDEYDDHDDPVDQGEDGEGGGDGRRRPMPMYTFGVLTDIQYAPIPDGHSYGGNARYYRHAREAAGYAARHFQEEGAQCVLNLGDIIDGKCADVERWGGQTTVAATVVVAEGGGGEEKKVGGGGGGGGGGVGHEAIDDVLEALGSYRAGPILHTYGNHELYNLSRLDLAKKLSIPFTLESTNDLVGYYDHVLHEPRHRGPRRRDGTDDDDDDSDHPWKLRFVVVDSFDICLLDRCPETSPKRRAAHEIMMANNPNYPEQENSPEGLVGLSRRFVAFNGGIDEPQLEWLARSMEDARANGERVIVCSHQPIHPDSSFPTCLVWNYEDVLSIVRKYADVVIASFSGHAHKGGYVRDEVSGVHFRTFEAMLESPSPVRTYAIVDMYSDSFVVRGSGDCVSDVYDLDHLNVNREKIAVANDL